MRNENDITKLNTNTREEHTRNLFLQLVFISAVQILFQIKKLRRTKENNNKNRTEPKNPNFKMAEMIYFPFFVLSLARSSQSVSQSQFNSMPDEHVWKNKMKKVRIPPF